jgi:hypothetical protein
MGRAMIRFLLRFLGVWLFAAALVVLVVDGARSIAASALVWTPLGELWHQLAPTSYIQVQFTVEEHLGQPWLWDLIVAILLSPPAWLVLGILGLILVVLGRRRHRPLSEDAYI